MYACRIKRNLSVEGNEQNSTENHNFSLAIQPFIHLFLHSPIQTFYCKKKKKYIPNPINLMKKKKNTLLNLYEKKKI